MIKAVKHEHLTSEARHLKGETLDLWFRRLSVTTTYHGVPRSDPRTDLESAGDRGLWGLRQAIQPLCRAVEWLARSK
jgi:hypothetical protein